MLKRAVVGAPIAAVLCLGLLVGPAVAHDITLGITGKLLKVDTRKDPEKHKVSFKTTKQFMMNPLIDPRLEETKVLIRWTGQGGVGAGRTDAITLDPFWWVGLGNPPGLKGYKYVDKFASRGGIRSALLARKASGMTLKIIARGENFPWEIGGPQDSVWLYWKQELEWYCAEFGGVIKKNEDGLFLAKDSPAPADSSCDGICGNGDLEAPEECDDGNPTDGDGCANDCTIEP